MGTYIDEVIKGMKSIKFNCLEMISLKKIMEYRIAGMQLTFYFFIIQMFMSYLANIFPTLTTFVILWWV